MGSEVFGMRACSRSLSALYAEMEGLLWATSCLRDMRIASVRLETDCSDLVDITINSKDWSIFATEIELLQQLQIYFEDVSLTHIPQSMNGRADALVKKTRIRGYIFFHIDQIRTDGDAPRRISSSVHHLI